MRPLLSFLKNINKDKRITLIIGYLFFVLFIFSVEGKEIYAQQLEITCFETQNQVLQKISPDSIFLPQRIKLSEVEKRFQKAILKNQENGYLNFSIDTFYKKDDTLKVLIYRGKKYEDYYFLIPDSSQNLIDNSTLRGYIFHNTIPWNKYASFAHKFVELYENSGYPFASISIQNLTKSSEVSLALETGPYIRFDSIVMKGDAKIGNGFLQSYLRFRHGRPYKEKYIKRIPRLLSELPYITLTRAPGVEFSQEGSTLYIFANKRKINQFDGYIGLVPIDETSGKIALSGEINLHLRNLFTIGETIDLQWKASERYSQDLNIHANFPCLLRTPLGIDGIFILEKKDTAYINNQYKVGIQYNFSGNNFLKVYYARHNSNLINTNTQIDIWDSYKKNIYGIEFHFRRLDYLYNPKKGIDIQFDFNLAQKVNESLEKSTQTSIITNIIGYIPIKKWWTIVICGKHGSLISNDLLTNELFRIGGMGTLQGFNDKSLYASSYTIGAAELRFIFAKNAYINLFVNGGVLKKQTTQQSSKDFPIGFGIGTTLETKAGQFYISYALGKLKDSQISFKTGKIHFGILVNF